MVSISHFTEYGPFISQSEAQLSSFRRDIPVLPYATRHDRNQIVNGRNPALTTSLPRWLRSVFPARATPKFDCTAISCICRWRRYMHPLRSYNYIKRIRLQISCARTHRQGWRFYTRVRHVFRVIPFPRSNFRQMILPRDPWRTFNAIPCTLYQDVTGQVLICITP